MVLLRLPHEPLAPLWVAQLLKSYQPGGTPFKVTISVTCNLLSLAVQSLTVPCCAVLCCALLTLLCAVFLVIVALRAPQVRVQDASKTELGVMSFEKARELAISQDVSGTAPLAV